MCRPSPAASSAPKVRPGPLLPARVGLFQKLKPKPAAIARARRGSVRTSCPSKRALSAREKPIQPPAMAANNFMPSSSPTPLKLWFHRRLHGAVCKSELNLALSSGRYTEPSAEFEKTCGPRSPAAFSEWWGFCLMQINLASPVHCTMTRWPTTIGYRLSGLPRWCSQPLRSASCFSRYRETHSV